MKLTFSLFSTIISYLVFITFIAYYLLLDNNAQRCLCRVSLGLHRSRTHYLLVSSCSYLVINVTKRQLQLLHRGKTTLNGLQIVQVRAHIEAGEVTR